MIKCKMSLVSFYGLLAWIFSVILNSFACWLASKLSLSGKNMTLFDNFPYLTNVDTSLKFYINQLGVKKPMPEVKSDRADIKLLLEKQNLSQELEEHIISSKNGNQTNGLRKVKNKLKLIEYEDMQ